MEDLYLTLKEESKGIYKEKGSKFLAFAFPVRNEKEIKEKLQTLKKTYHDARHHCYAYKLGKNQETFRVNDAGEPAHSAGDPILGQIRSNKLTNVLVVVVRYYGGTKLGVGGLISAYKTAASEAILANTIVTGLETENMEIQFDYPDINQVMQLIQELDLQIAEQYFGEKCKLILEIRKSLFQKAGNKFSLISSLRIRN